MSMTTEELVARRVHINEQIDRLTQEKQQIDEKLREEHDLGKHEVGDWTLTVRANRRLNAQRFEQRFPVAQYPHLYRAAVDSAALKDNFAPVDLEQFYDVGAPVLVVK